MQMRCQLYYLAGRSLKSASGVVVTRTFKVNLVGTFEALEAIPKVELQLNVSRVYHASTLKLTKLILERCVLSCYACKIVFDGAALGVTRVHE